MCPEFLSKSICEEMLTGYNWNLFGTRLQIPRGIFNGIVSKKFNSENKKKYCSKILKLSKFGYGKTIGFGDSETDKEFLKILDYSYTFDRQIVNSKIKFKDSDWVNLSGK